MRDCNEYTQCRNKCVRVSEFLQGRVARDLTEAIKSFLCTRMFFKSELCLIPALIDAVVDALTAHTLAAAVMEPPLAFTR